MNRRLFLGILIFGFLNIYPVFCQQQPGNPDQGQMPAIPVREGLAFFFSLGQESLSPTSVITGGSYIYEEGSVEFNKFAALGIRYTSNVLPEWATNSILTAFCQVSWAWTNSFGADFSVAYGFNFRQDHTLYQMLSARICLISSGRSYGNFTLELLPVSVWYCLYTKEFSWGFEFVRVGFRL